jgi:hypothetical protein
MPGVKSTAPNCRFDASVGVHSLRSGTVMSAMRQLRHAWNVSSNKIDRMKLIGFAPKTKASKMKDIPRKRKQTAFEAVKNSQIYYFISI